MMKPQTRLLVLITLCAAHLTGCEFASAPSSARSTEPATTAPASTGSVTPNSDKYPKGEASSAKVIAANRTFVFSLFQEVFGAEATNFVGYGRRTGTDANGNPTYNNSGSPLIKFNLSANLFGGVCDPRQAGDCAGNNSIEAQPYQDVNVLSLASVQRACEVVVSPVSMTFDPADTNQGLYRVYRTATGTTANFYTIAPTQSHLISIYKMFYRVRTPTPQTLAALERVRDAGLQQGANDSEKIRNAWAHVTSTICAHPGWMVL